MRNIQIGGRSFMATLHKPLPAHIAAVAAANPGILQAFERGDAALQAAARSGLAVPRPERASAPAVPVGAPAPNHATGAHRYAKMTPMQKHELWQANPAELERLRADHATHVAVLRERLAAAETYADRQAFLVELGWLGAT